MLPEGQLAMGFRLWEELLLGRLLPSVSSTISSLLIVLLVVRAFRVRNPETRYILFHLPLVKGLLVLVRGVPEPLPGFEGRVRFGIQLLDPFSLIPMPSWSEVPWVPDFQAHHLQPEWDSSFLAAALFMTVGAAIGVLVYRWVGLAVFYRRLLARRPATREAAPQLFQALDGLVSAFRVPYPRVVVVDELGIAPCTVGLRPPTMVLPSRMLRELDQERLEAVLAHELAHVSRRDGFFHWLSLLLRDLLAFNPVAHWMFDWLLVEREKDADLRAARVIGRPRSVAKALVDVALLMQGASLRPAPGSMAIWQSLLGRTAVVQQRVAALTGPTAGKSRLRPVGIALAFLFVALVRIWLHFPVAGHVVMLE